MSPPKLNVNQSDLKTQEVINGGLQKRILLILHDFWVRNSLGESNAEALITFKGQGKPCMIFF